MKLQVLVNHYREPTAILNRLLKSVFSQAVSEDDSVEILVCTDGYEHELDSLDISKGPFPVYYYVKPHRGVCATRNVLLNQADGDYVMFCDADDMFIADDGLQKLLQAAKDFGADIVGSAYSAEIRDGDSYRYRTMNYDMIRLHGKIFNREYLCREQIRFPDEMTFSGDMYMLWLAYHLTEQIVWLPDIFYMWKWQPGSVTRSSEYYSLQSYEQMLKCYMLVLDELQKHGESELFDSLAAASVLSSYIDWYSQKFREAPDKYTEIAKSAIRKSVARLLPAYEKIPVNKRKRIYNSILFQKRTYGPPGKFVGFERWAHEITGI